MTPEALRDLLVAVPRECVVLVDEAYHEYMDDDVRVSAVSMLDLHPGLVVSRTFSKAYGLAGLRVGYGIGQPETLEPMDRVRMPANVNAVGMAAAMAALDDREHVDRSVRMTREGRDRLAAATLEKVFGRRCFEILYELRREGIVADGNLKCRSIKIPVSTRDFAKIVFCDKSHRRQSKSYRNCDAHHDHKNPNAVHSKLIHIFSLSKKPNVDDYENH